MYLTHLLKFHLINYMFEYLFSLLGLSLYPQHIQCSMYSSLSLKLGIQEGRQDTELPSSISLFLIGLGNNVAISTEIFKCFHNMSNFPSIN